MDGNPTYLGFDLTPEAALALLEWQAEMGADEPMLDAPVDRFDMPEPVEAARPAPIQTPATRPAAAAPAAASRAPEDNPLEALVAEATMTGGEGARRITVSGDATDLALGIDRLDRALRGRTSLTAIAQEKDGAFAMETLRLANPQLTADGKGSFAAGALDAALNLDVPDLGALGAGLQGSLRASATATERSGVRVIEATGTAGKLDALEERLGAYGIQELCRSGRIALERGFKTLAPPHLKEHAPAE